MSLAEQDLLSALRELCESSKVMTSGSLPTGDQLDRYLQATAWAERLIRQNDRNQELSKNY